ncbi:MAG: zinc dependent phospholipase C family protein [Patescibacteria group bacterium]|jgi:hypothetical protein
MPKENTHLFFAHEVKAKFNPELAEIIRKYKDYYYLGSVAPDIFFYGSKKDWKVSAALHGKDGEPANKIVIEILELAKEKRSHKNLAFAIGYLTHCALDEVFHPVVVYLTGDIFSEDPKVLGRANYLHRQWETELDEDINGRYFFSQLVKIRLFGKLAYPKIIRKRFGLPFNKFFILANKHRLVNFLTRSRPAYYLLKLLVKSGLYIKKEDLALCYSNLENEKKLIPSGEIVYRDIISGVNKKTSVAELLGSAEAKALVMINASFKYFRGQAGKEELLEKVPGESLETGRINCPTSKIKYFKE